MLADPVGNASLTSVRTDHSSGRPGRVKTAQGRVKPTTSCPIRWVQILCEKKHNQPTFYETTAANSHCIRALSSIPEAAILSLLVHMLSCAWWERSVHFCLVPCSECCQCDLSWVTMDPSAEACLWTEVLHTNLYYFHRYKLLCLGCQLKTYPQPRPINSGSSGCNLDFAIFKTCQGNIISSKKTKHSSVIRIHRGSGR